MAKHLDSLQIKNFRMLEDFAVEKLGDVNLIVGKNNSGKSTVLEALLIYTFSTGFIFQLLTELAEKKDENSDLSGFFSESTNNYSSFLIGDFDEEKTLRIIFCTEKGRHLLNKIKHQNNKLIEEVFFEAEILKKTKILDEKICIATKSNTYTACFWPDKNGDFKAWGEGEVGRIARSVVDTQLPKMAGLAMHWDKLVFTDAESTTIEALKIIEPNITGLAFVQNPSNSKGERTAIVRLSNKEHPMPIKSLGEGVQRVLQIALNVHAAKDGFLLIDEFENGLHYSVQEKVWRMIFEMAQRLNIQVFATTHSRDCIEAFTKVANEHPVEGLLFRMGRSAKASDEGKIIATIFDEAKLQRFSDMDMDVR